MGANARIGDRVIVNVGNDESYVPRAADVVQENPDGSVNLRVILDGDETIMLPAGTERSGDVMRLRGCVRGTGAGQFLNLGESVTPPGGT